MSEWRVKGKYVGSAAALEDEIGRWLTGGLKGDMEFLAERHNADVRSAVTRERETILQSLGRDYRRTKRRGDQTFSEGVLWAIRLIQARQRADDALALTHEAPDARTKSP